MLQNMRKYAEKSSKYYFINSNVSMDIQTRYFMLEFEGDDVNEKGPREMKASKL